VNQWTRVNANTVAVTLLDGGVFDLDGAVNGVIVDPIAVGGGSGARVSLPFVASAGGCVLVDDSDAPADPSLPMMILLSICWLFFTRKTIRNSGVILHISSPPRMWKR